MLLFSVSQLLPNYYMPWKELNPPCISEQIRKWKCREQENVYGICRGADMRSAGKPKYWGYILAHHTGILPPSLAGAVSLLSDRTSDRTRIVLCMCQKMPASKARPDGNNRMSEIQQRNESWGSRALWSSSNSPSARSGEATAQACGC